jgi:hypothetical protein
LTPVLNEIFADSALSLEINPVKVYEAYIIDFETRTGQPCPLPKKVEPEEAANTPEIKKIVEASEFSQISVQTSQNFNKSSPKFSEKFR